MGVFTWWIVDGGGYEPIDWLPGGMLAIAVATVLIGAVHDRLPPLGRPLVAAIAAFGAYAVWSYLSILWADDPGAALSGSHRTLVFFVCFTAFAVLPWTPRAAIFAISGMSLIVAVLAGGTLLDLAAAADPRREFLDGRLSEPLGYPNATAALVTAAALPALVLASRPELPGPLRVVLLGAAPLLLEIAVMTQSRGWLMALPVLAVFVLALTPGRLRLVLFAIPVLGAVALASPELLDPYQVGRGPGLAEAVDGATRAVVVTSLLTLLAGAALVLLDQRLEPSARVRRVTGRAAVALGVLAAVAACGAALVATDFRPADKASDAWAEFKGETDATYDESSRFTALRSPRYNTWATAVEAWREKPVAGLGQDNFAERYLLTRRTAEEPRWPHSLGLRLLVHTGLVGTLMFLAFVVLAAMAVVRGSRGAPLLRALAVAATVPAVIWVVHGSVDWLWEYPALSGPALALLGLAARLGAGPLTRGGEHAQRPALMAGVGTLAVLALLALGSSFVAERDAQSAGDWRTDSAGVLDRLDRAQRFNRLDYRPALDEGLIAWRLGDRRRARRAMLEAARRKPRDWFVQLELGLLSGEVKDLRRAVGHLRAALERNPKDDVVRLALRRAESGRPLPAAEAERLLVERWTARAGVDG
jgi:hypothetical protein